MFCPPWFCMQSTCQPAWAVPWQVFCDPEVTSWIVTPSTTSFTGCATVDPPQKRKASSGAFELHASKPPTSPPWTVTPDERMKADRKPPSLIRTSTRPGLHSELQTLRSPRVWPEPDATIPSMWKWLALTLSAPTVTVAPAAGRKVTAADLED